MKKTLLSVLAIALMTFSATTMNAQSDADHTMAIKANPLALAFSIYNASFEKSMGKSSFLVGASIANKILGVDVSSYGADVGYRYYMTGGNLEGFYVNPKLGFSLGSSGDLSYSTFGLAAELGYQIKTDGGFVFDIGIGPSWNKLSGDYDGIGFDNEGSGTYTSPSGTLALGYAF